MQDGNEDFFHTGIRFNTTRQGFFSVGYMAGHETWRGQRFRLGQRRQHVRLDSAVPMAGPVRQLQRRLRDFLRLRQSVPGPLSQRRRRADFQPNQHLTQDIDINTVRFNRASTGERIYSVNIVNSKTTYQFDKHFLVRFLAQDDSSAKRVLTDLLASYKFVPGTVAHAGYGSLYKQDPEFFRRPPLDQSGLPDGQSRLVPESVVPAAVLSGMRRNRSPVASNTAFAMAASVGLHTVSPAP